MKLEIADRVDAADWDALIVSLGGSICLCSTYARYIIAGEPNASPRYIRAVSDAGQVVGAALGFEAKSPSRWLGALTRQFSLAALPVVRPEVTDGPLEFLRLLEDQTRRASCVELTVGSLASRGGQEELGALGFTLTRRMEFELSLAPSEADLFRAMAHKRRKDIKKAGRLSVAVKEMSNQEGLAELRRLQGDSAERIVARGGRNITYKGQHVHDPVTVLLESGLGRLVGAEVEGEIVSAGLFTLFNGLVYHTLSGHSRKALETRAPTFLIWEMIKRYQEEGAKRFNFGGCSADAVEDGHPEHGLYGYKKAFGTECITLADGHKVLRRATHAIVGSLKFLLRR